MSVDKYLDRRYDAKNYNCAHFACDVWLDVSDSDLSAVLNGFLCPPRQRIARHSQLRAIRFFDAPKSPCIVLFQHKMRSPHIGVYLRGKVLHIAPGSGVRFQSIEVARLGFERVRFFTC